MKRPTLMIAAWVAATFLLFTFAQAQTPPPDTDDAVRVVAKKLNCPTCSGRNLADCPTETCLQWKAEIKAQLDQGKNPSEVLQYFEDRFGTTVLQEPPKSGNTLALWAVPVGAALMLVGGGALIVRRISRGARPASQPAPASQDPYVAELERQVKDSA